eukprot:SAG11_NODE_19830_length_457_cov_21.444134_1_plen_102_part_01
MVKTTEFDGCALLEAHLGDLPRASARVWGCLGGAGKALSICIAYGSRKATIQLAAAFLKNERRTVKTSSKRDEDPWCHGHAGKSIWISPRNTGLVENRFVHL